MHFSYLQFPRTKVLKSALKNVLFLGLFEHTKTTNFAALLTRNENALGNIFTSLCCNFDTKHTCKRSFNRPIRLSLRVMWICCWIYCGRSAKTAIVLSVWFLKIKISLASFSLIFEKTSLKGFSLQNMKKSMISVLKFNYRYLQSPGLKK